MDIDLDFESKLDENIAKFCSSPGNSVDTLCSKMRTLSTVSMAVKAAVIALAACLLTRALHDPVYGQMLLVAAMVWYLNKYTSLRESLVEQIIRKSYEKSRASAPSLREEDSKGDPASSASEDPDDVPAPTS